MAKQRKRRERRYKVILDHEGEINLYLRSKLSAWRERRGFHQVRIVRPSFLVITTTNREYARQIQKMIKDYYITESQKRRGDS